MSDRLKRVSVVGCDIATVILFLAGIGMAFVFIPFTHFTSYLTAVLVTYLVLYSLIAGYVKQLVLNNRYVD